MLLQAASPIQGFKLNRYHPSPGPDSMSIHERRVGEGGTKAETFVEGPAQRWRARQTRLSGGAPLLPRWAAREAGTARGSAGRAQRIRAVPADRQGPSRRPLRCRQMLCTCVRGERTEFSYL